MTVIMLFEDSVICDLLTLGMYAPEPHRAAAKSGPAVKSDSDIFYEALIYSSCGRPEEIDLWTLHWNVAVQFRRH